MPPRNTRTSSFLFDGGLNLADSPLAVQPGQLLWCKNYEIPNTGGYRRVSGFEPIDGSAKPSEAEYVVVEYSSGTGILAGATVTGQTSGAQAIVLEDAPDAVGDLILYEVSDTIQEGENLLVDAAVAAVAEVAPLSGREADSVETYNARVYLAQMYVQSQISPVPGSGPIRGVWFYKGTIYAFRDSADGTACGMYGSSSTGWQAVTTPTLAPGGKYRFVNYNFTGHSGTLTMFGCDGQNKAFMFDGTTFTQLTTGMTTDKPLYIAAHKNHLFLAFSGGSVQHSAINDPTTWSVVLGAAEMAVGDEVTGMLPLSGGTLLLFTRNTTKIIYGSDSSSWEIKNLLDNVGAIPESAQQAFVPVFANEYGLSVLEQSDSFGDFQDMNISLPVQRVLDNNRGRIIGSTIVRSRNQYRLFFETGEALVMSFSGATIRGFTLSDYGIPIRCVSGTSRGDSESTEEDELFFGSDDGYVYQMDSGRSFAGNKIQAFLRLPPNYIASSMMRMKKFFRMLILEIESDEGGPVSLYFKPDFSLMNSQATEAIQEELNTSISGGEWDTSTWDQFLWSSDDEEMNFYEIRPEGVGLAMGGLLYSESVIDEPYTIKSAIIHFSVRGVKR